MPILIRFKLLLLSVVLGVAIMALPTMASAQNGNSPAQPAELKSQPSYSTEGVVRQVISEIVQSVDNAFKSLANQAFDDAGQTIMWVLVAVLMAWYAVRSFIGNGINAFLEEAITLMMIVGVIQLLLWSGGITAIEKFVNSIASSIAGAQLTDLPSTLNSILNSTFTAAMRIMSMPSIETNSGFSLDKIVVFFPQNLMQYIAKFIAAAFTILGACIYVANVILAYGMIIIAKALAPLLIPWLLLPSTSFLFDGWLRFFLGACLVKVIGAFFIKLTNNWIEGIVNVSSTIKLDTSVDAYSLYAGNFIVYLAIIFMAGLVAYLMIMIPGVASGIISGSAARSGFSGMSTLTSGMGGRAIGKASSAGVNSIGRAGVSAGRAAANMMKGRPSITPVSIGAKVSSKP